MRRLLAAIVVALLVAPAAAHAMPEIGISQSYLDVDHIYPAPGAAQPEPLFAKLGIKASRVIVPFDIATRHDEQRAAFDKWMNRTDGIQQFVVLGPSDLRTATPAGKPKGFLAPPGHAYKDAFEAFWKQWGGRVDFVAAWNEPNEDRVPALPSTGLKGRPSFLPEGDGKKLSDPGCPADPKAVAERNCGPYLAAVYYRVARRVCACRVVAGEFNSTPNATGYWGAYMDAVNQFFPGAPPQFASFHGHHDAKPDKGEGHACKPPGDLTVNCVAISFDNFAASKGWTQQATTRWDTEVGVDFNAVKGTDKARGAAQECRYRRLLWISNAAHVARIMYYNARAYDKNVSQDRGLLSAGTGKATKRPIYTDVLKRVDQTTDPGC